MSSGRGARNSRCSPLRGCATDKRKACNMGRLARPAKRRLA
eukprot:CAMPEP_0171142020 /NCGR_PEP_ID=MMETSP0766_2-20121228/141665_1 /TAXON_ID=439317 /ORGANISM="Gambierdiscus australes, Strain CAWD 149" /LENGTH=40 /DNA_ID= /DNA_START= /DNA_END= /DNA_ORIENTATION=